MSVQAEHPDIVIERFARSARPMRIAVVTETWPPEVNGVAITLARMVGGLHDRGHDIQLVRPRQSTDEPDAGLGREGFGEVLTRGVPIPRYPHLKLGIPARRRLSRLWSTQRPDVVHIATEGPLGWSALLAATHLRLPVATDFRTNFHSYSDHYGVGWLRAPIASYLRKFHNRAGCTLVPTEALRRELETVGFRRVRVVSRGVDRLLFSPERRSDALRAAWGAGPDDVVVACVGRLAPEKNLATLELAFEAIRATRPGARLLLVGDGPSRAELQSRWPDALFAGQRRGEDLAAHYASADLFVFASLTETFGNVTAEALASGLPVVAFDYAAASQLIRHDHSGVLVPRGDRDGFVAAAVALARDAGRRHRLGAEARAVSASHGWDAVVVRFEQALSTVIAEAACAPADAALAARLPTV
ncbi:MAG: glycosyltransferase family 1 protein [Burkholderiales bacterium]|nr:MAG: glycosyltransferase family 1 protein [Burkholderiales bacterium]